MSRRGKKTFIVNVSFQPKGWCAIKVYELFSNPSRFTTGEFARDKHGLEVRPNEDNAVCWCAIGGIRYCYNDSPSKEKNAYGRLVEYVSKNTAYGYVHIWNDAVGYNEVLRVLKELDI